MDYALFVRVINGLDYTLTSAASRRDAKQIPATLATRDALFALYPVHRDKLNADRANA